jgi:hypothetical protein
MPNPRFDNLNSDATAHLGDEDDSTPDFKDADGYFRYYYDFHLDGTQNYTAIQVNDPAFQELTGSLALAQANLGLSNPLVGSQVGEWIGIFPHNVPTAHTGMPFNIVPGVNDYVVDTGSMTGLVSAGPGRRPPEMGGGHRSSPRSQAIDPSVCTAWPRVIGHPPGPALGSRLE